MIGTYEEAAEILAYWNACEDVRLARQFANINDDEIEFPPLPTGWEEIGEGAYRVAFLSPSNVVYKIEYDWSPSHGNEGEWETYCEVLSTPLPSGWRIAEMNLIEVGEVPVIASEFIPGGHEEVCIWSNDFCSCVPNHNVFAKAIAEMDRVAHALRISDMHAYNYALDLDGTRVVIDLGS